MLYRFQKILSGNTGIYFKSAKSWGYFDICQLHLKLPKMSSIERIKQNTELAKRTIAELKSELVTLNQEFNIIMSRELREENTRLLAAVEDAKQKLINLEVKNGIPQIPILESVENVHKIPEQEPVVKEKIVAKKSNKKEKQVQEAKPSKVEPSEATSIDVGRLDFRIGVVEDVQRHPDADSLYVLKINCGEENPRTVCSGLVKHIAIEKLNQRTVMVLCNLKPVKMRGITSEAMVMCASSEQGVEVLIPPKGTIPGDLVHCEGYTRQPDPVMNPKKKIFETVAPDLHTNNELKACYKGVPLMVLDKGPVLTESLANVPVKPIVENVDRHVSTYCIAKELKIGHKTVWNELHKAGLQKKTDVWAPHELPKKNVLEYAKSGLMPKQVLLCFWWDCKAIIHYELFPSGQILSSDFYCRGRDLNQVEFCQKLYIFKEQASL